MNKEKPPFERRVKEVIKQVYDNRIGEDWTTRAAAQINHLSQTQIQQAKAEVAREIEHFMQMHLHARPDEPTATMKFSDWMKLRKLLSKYMEGK